MLPCLGGVDVSGVQVVPDRSREIQNIRTLGLEQSLLRPPKAVNTLKNSYYGC